MRHLRTLLQAPLPGLCSIIGVLLTVWAPALAQQAAPHTHADGNHGHDEALPVLCGICPLSREADGTAWQPDDTPGHAHGWTIGDWQVAAHLQIAAIDTHESGPRGDSQVFSTNYAMVSARFCSSRKPRGDSFEDPVLDPAWQVILLNNGTVTLSTAQNNTPGGQQSLAFSTTGPGQRNLYLERSLGTATAGTATVHLYDTGLVFTSPWN